MDVDDCLSSPCTHGATCIDEVDSHACACAPGWSGAVCDAQVDPCQGSENDCDAKLATCIHVGVLTHECMCHAGYETMDGGRTCSDIMECASSPCANGATCFDETQQFRCSCLPGWSGELCGQNVDDCRSYPCANGGTCKDLVSAYKCDCSTQLPFTGANCALPITANCTFDEPYLCGWSAAAPWTQLTPQPPTSATAVQHAHSGARFMAANVSHAVPHHALISPGFQGQNSLTFQYQARANGTDLLTVEAFNGSATWARVWPSSGRHQLHCTTWTSSGQVPLPIGTFLIRFSVRNIGGASVGSIFVDTVIFSKVRAT